MSSADTNSVTAGKGTLDQLKGVFQPFRDGDRAAMRLVAMHELDAACEQHCLSAKAAALALLWQIASYGEADDILRVIAAIDRTTASLKDDCEDQRALKKRYAESRKFACDALAEARERPA